MAEPATRVALLARPGAACDNLQAVLRQAGADVVAVQDPADGNPADIAAAHPAAVLVALEPAIEEALERYEAVLSAPGRLVIYDEVAVAARREGWDAARWARHLAAKLGGHANVLPPGVGADDACIREPLRDRVPTPSRVHAEAGAPAPPPVTEPAPEPEPGAAFDAFDADSVHLGLEPAQEEALASAGEGIDFGGFTPEVMAAMAMEPMSTPVPEARDDAMAVPALEAAHEPEPVFELEPVFAPAPEPALPPEPAPVFAAPAESGDANVLEWESFSPTAPIAPTTPSTAAAPEPESTAQPAAPAPMSFSASEMTLVDMDPGGDAAGSATFAPTAPPAPSAPPPAIPAGSGAGSGGVVVLAGIGGPDAVRQFLAALPGGFPRPIIVRQRLDGGRHDRLVRQMQRATALPVELAEAGRPLVAGHVYILPDDMTTTGDGAASFAATDAAVPVLAGLPAARSAVLVLSGSDPASVPELLEAARDGAYVAGQAPEDSFDGAAAAALVAAGGESCTAAELAQRISSRWLS